MLKIWRIKENKNHSIRNTFNISPLLFQLLINRGFDTSAKIQTFLKGSSDDFHSPMLLKDMDKAVSRILKAKKRGEKALLYGDYDVDGITSVVLLAKLFKKLDVPFFFYHPHRLEEGYGFHLSALQTAKNNGASLIITADCGITNNVTVEEANKAGLDVIITDHHKTIQGKIPEALAVIDPQQEDCSYPYKKLAGVGVVFKLIQGVFQQLGIGPSMKEYLEIAALGTVVDVAPLTGENRIITKLGLQIMNDYLYNSGIVALREVAGLLNKEVNTGHLGFQIGPRLNASGRLLNASLATELLLLEDERRCNEIAWQLDQENAKRKALQETMIEEAKEEIEVNPDLYKGKVLVVAKEKWHPGLIGLVASFLQESYYKPALVISTDNGIAHGSARSIPEFHIFDALVKLDPLLIKFGGHKQAAGFTLKADHLSELRQEINTLADTCLSDTDLTPKLDIDLILDLSDLSFDYMKQLDLLRPFGIGNPAPTLASFNCRLKSAPRLIGRDNQHLKFRVSDSLNQSFDCVGWNMAERLPECRSNYLDLAFRPCLNTWNGNTSVQLHIEDFRPSRA